MGKPRALADAELIVNLLERFGGYTYSSLMQEDARFLRIVRMADTVREVEGESDSYDE